MSSLLSSRVVPVIHDVVSVVVVVVVFDAVVDEGCFLLESCQLSS